MMIIIIILFFNICELGLKSLLGALIKLNLKIVREHDASSSAVTTHNPESLYILLQRTST